MELRVEEVFVDPDCLPEPCGWRILVEPVQVIACTEIGIQLPDQTIHAQEYLRNVGRVIAIGPEAYRHEKFVSERAWIQAGDWVSFGQYAGQEIRVRGQKADGSPGIARFRFLNDDEIFGKIPDPNAVLIPF